jgi:hypothetical protein
MTKTKNEIRHRGDGRVWIRYRHDKNGNLMGFATTDEIGSVTDMTKTKNEIRDAGGFAPPRRAGAAAEGVRRLTTAFGELGVLDAG